MFHRLLTNIILISLTSSCGALLLNASSTVRASFSRVVPIYNGLQAYSGPYATSAPPPRIISSYLSRVSSTMPFNTEYTKGCLIISWTNIYVKRRAAPCIDRIVYFVAANKQSRQQYPNCAVLLAHDYDNMIRSI